MKDNEVISKARGECRHEGVVKLECAPDIGLHYWCPDCGLCVHFYDFHKYHHAPDYETDPGAWTPELYEWIDGKGLRYPFIIALADELKLPFSTMSLTVAWYTRIAVPQQAAAALARTITEVNNE